MPKTLAKTYSESLQQIVQEHIDSGEEWPARAREIAAWAYRTKRWKPHREGAVKQCADDLARAMREDYYTDPQGRRVRAKHAARFRSGDKQLTLWADIRSAPPEHMGVAFQQRRQQVVGDCRQLKTDVESYNDNNPMGAFIQMSFNFEKDLEEIELTNESLRRQKPR